MRLCKGGLNKNIIRIQVLNFSRTSWIAWSPRLGLEPIENRIQQSNYDKLAKETIRYNKVRYVETYSR